MFWKQKRSENCRSNSRQAVLLKVSNLSFSAGKVSPECAFLFERGASIITDFSLKSIRIQYWSLNLKKLFFNIS